MTFSALVIAQAGGPTAGSETRHEWTYEALRISDDGLRKELWTADFENRTVSILVEAQPNTTPEHLAEAHVIIESIRSDPDDTGAFKLTFMLPDGWDSG